MNEGSVVGFEIVEPGAYYDPEQNASLFINGEDFTDQVVLNIEYLLVSYVYYPIIQEGHLDLGLWADQEHM